MQPKLYHMGFRGKVSRSTLADANETHDWRIYADFAQALIRIARPLYARDPIGVDLDQSLYALDSTTIDLCLALFPWAKFRRRKALLGMSMNHPEMVVLGFAGGLLHVLNHALFKGLLFLGAGAVIHGTGTGELDALGGLRRSMPITAITFLVGAAAISGLPPLNGFISEFLIYLGSYEEEIFLSAAGSIPALAVIGSLVIIGGLAAACFTKAFGIVFLGEPRSERARNPQPPGKLMLVPMVLPAVCCFAVALAAPRVVAGMATVLADVTGTSAAEVGRQLGEVYLLESPCCTPF